ncbi:hypothetical protein [Fibrobacter sp. UWB10]|nr:hypothetical protein [Fibrobacter sp. UWB10]
MPYLNTSIQLRHNLAHFWYLSEAKVQKTKELAYCHVKRLEDAGA